VPSDTEAVGPPPPDAVSRTVLMAFVNWLGERHGKTFTDYDELWRWSTTDPAQFWTAIAQFYDVHFDTTSDNVLADESMPGASWFPGATLNYAEQALRHDKQGPAIVAISEGTDSYEVTWDRLRAEVGAVAAWLVERGVAQGDRVVGYLPNIPQAVVAFLAAASVGAIWSACSQEFSPQGAADRLSQLDPVVLVVANGYRYAGHEHSRTAEVAELRRLLPTVRATLAVQHIGGSGTLDTESFEEVVATSNRVPPRPVPFDHPLWVLYSSGTTGKPKGIVHGHGGIMLEHLKFLGLHLDLSEASRFCWYTSTSWMMWNIQVSGLLRGSTIVLYDGSPNWPTQGALWELAQRARLTFLGTSAAYLIASQKAGEALAAYDFGQLHALGSTGSPLPASTAEWVTKALPDVWLVAASGGTDISSGFAGGVPTLPVHPGEMQARMLGVAMEAWDSDGHPLVDEIGELVVTKPMPSMPLFFWNDPDGQRYRDAYFSTFRGVWRHGDWVTVTSHGGVVVHGRSDATMNKFGVRMGSAEIYAVVDQLPEITDSLIIGLEEPDGGYWMPLFVVLSEASSASPELSERIRQAIRTDLSPRHVPDDIIVVPALPHTMTGKRMEIPVKRLLQGVRLEDAASTHAVANPQALQQFVSIATRRSLERASMLDGNVG